MEIVSEGSLESISRPASTSKRCSSRSSVKSASRSNQHSLEFLPPEEPTLNLSANFEVEDDIVVTDLTEDVNLDNEQELPLTDESSSQDNVEHVNQKIINCSLSSEESALPHKPKKEIIHSVKEDRCTNPLKLENTTENFKVPNKSDVNTNQDENDLEIHSAESESSSTAGSYDNDDLDPKIRKGMERIKKLDNILIEKVKREKEVKKQRRDQERLWREHLEMLEKSRKVELGKPVDLGPAHMLALGAPNDTEDTISEDSPPVTPLFATQPPVDEERLQRQKQQEETSFETHEHSVNTQDGDDMSSNGCKASVSQGETKEEKEKKNKKNKKDRKVKKKDFIKRNILLAADASNVVAMTEEEKKRLEEILSDMGDLTEESVNKESLTLFGNGFVPSQEEVKQLKDIDARLQTLVSSEEYAALCGQTGRERDTQSLQVVETPRSEIGSFISDEDIPTFGELVLQEKKEMREMKQRLVAIEEELQRFQYEDHNEGFLSESLLRQLLDESSRTTSQATTILDRISSTSMSCDTTSSFDKNSVILDTSSTSALEQ